MARITAGLTTSHVPAIGAALAAQVLADGNSVIGTFRSAAQATAFDGAAPGRSFGMVADVCDDDAVRAAVADGTAKAGAPEVVVNAAIAAKVRDVLRNLDQEIAFETGNRRGTSFRRLRRERVRRARTPRPRRATRAAVASVSSQSRCVVVSESSEVVSLRNTK